MRKRKMSTKIRKKREFDNSYAWFDKRTGEEVDAPSNKFDTEGKSSAYVINDSMDEIKSPINPKLRFSSKRDYYNHIRQSGYEIVGNEYERGYDPGKIREREIEQRVDAKIKQNLIDRMIHGKR
jgi:hypothetical protein